MRLTGQERMGYCLTPPRITNLIRERLDFPGTAFAALDPCAGCGAAFASVTMATKGKTYDIEPVAETSPASCFPHGKGQP